MNVQDILIPTYLNMLSAMAAWLRKAQTLLPETESEALLSNALAADMFPLATQVRFSCLQALEGVSRISGQPFPALHGKLISEDSASPDKPDTFEDLYSRLTEVCDWVEAQSVRSFDSPEPVALEMPNGMIFDLSVEQYARDWALAQFYFHVMAAYAILRNQGIPLGKPDYVSHIRKYLREG